MATVPAPRTWGSSELVTAAKLNTDIRDAWNFFKSPPLAQLRKSATQSYPNSTTAAVTWDVEVIDRDGGHSTVTNNTRYTAQTAGWYYMRAMLVWDVTATSTGWQDLYFRKNGSGGQNRSVLVTTTSPFHKPHSTEGNIQLAVGDYVEVMAVILASPGSITLHHQVGPPTYYTQWDIRWVAA